MLKSMGFPSGKNSYKVNKWVGILINLCYHILEKNKRSNIKSEITKRKLRKSS